MEALREAIRNGWIEPIVKFEFGVDLTPTQIEIVRDIAYSLNNRVVISCLTRYGKSYCVSIGVLLYILFNTKKRVLLISPTLDQTKIIRNYISEFISKSSLFNQLICISSVGVDRIKNEVSKKRITFKNDCELTILSAEGTATRLMGWGGDLVILDESALIDYEVYRSRISRMLGDNKDSVLIEIGNPWDRLNQMWEHWLDPKFKKYHVDCNTALKEGRIDPVFLEEQRALLTPLEFEVLYNANFPEEAVDGLFTYKKVIAAVNRKVIYPNEKATTIISCDVADKGIDKTVIIVGRELDGKYQVDEIYSENKSENMQVAGKIIDYANTKNAKRIFIDTIGVGVGVVSRVREVIGGSVDVIACHFGEGAGIKGDENKPTTYEMNDERKSDSTSKRMLNRKAEQYFRLKEIFDEGLISIPNNQQLITELMKMRFEFSSSGKLKIIDPEEKSPDFADALCYFIWKVGRDIIFDYGSAEREVW